MDGILVIDKPQGPTSHDVVAAARRILGEKRIGHTGTLDPLATGVLPLAIGRATRLVRFLAASDKDYHATIRFGLTTDSYDITGAETSRSDAVPSRDDVVRGLGELRGDYLQTPPALSAKKIDGRRAYQLARQQQSVALAAAPVRVVRAELLEFTGPRARVALTCSAGFYVRSFAHSLGAITGTGACLEALQRTRSGDFGLDLAISLEQLQGGRDGFARLIPLDALLAGFPAVTITEQGRAYVSHGRQLEPADYEPVGATHASPRPHASAAAEWVRLLDARGALVGVGTRGTAPGSLHPSVVLI